MDAEHLLRRSAPSTSRDSEPPDDEEEARWEPDYEWPPQQDLPYGGRVPVARRSKHRRWDAFIELTLVLLAVGLGVGAYVYVDEVLHQVHMGLAHMGHAEAQHTIAQRYLQGIGVEHDMRKAVHWLQKAADSGHPEASYNLAVAHMKNHVKLPKGKARRLIEHAKRLGVEESEFVHREVCGKSGRCDT